MTITNGYLFVYGTLLAHGNSYAAYLQQHCKFVGEGKFSGRLYDIGEYPGAIIDADKGHFVYGRIFLMDDAQEVLDIIDGYEGIGPNEPQPHEYLRNLVDIDAGNGLITCWVYLYNWPVDGMFQIQNGTYSLYLNDK